MFSCLDTIYLLVTEGQTSCDNIVHAMHMHCEAKTLNNLYYN